MCTFFFLNEKKKTKTKMEKIYATNWRKGYIVREEEEKDYFRKTCLHAPNLIFQ